MKVLYIHTREYEWQSKNEPAGVVLSIKKFLGPISYNYIKPIMASTHHHDFSIGGKMGDSAGARTGEKSSGSKNGPQILQIYYLAPSYM